MDQIVCSVCSALGLPRSSAPSSYEGCPVCYDLFAAREQADTGCGCIVCSAVRACPVALGKADGSDPEFRLKVGLGLPAWLRELLHYETVLAVRAQVAGAMHAYFERSLEEAAAWCCQRIEKRAEPETQSTEERFILDVVCSTQHCQQLSARRQSKRRRVDNAVTPREQLRYSVRIDWQSCPILYEGHYLKLCRDLAQTKWINRDYSSIEELLTAHLAPHHSPNGSSHLIGSGREDVDVCMLGAGRKFLFELRKPVNYAPIEGDELELREGAVKITGLKRVEVKNIQSVSAVTRAFNAASATKIKVYGFVVCCSEPITNLEKLNARFARTTLSMEDPALQIEQRTPSRVAHRRANLVRKKQIFSLRLAAIASNERAYVCQLIGSGGLYIKEFVHGDFGRTQPSFAEAVGVTTADLVQLDVLNLLEAPPELAAAAGGDDD